MQKLEGIARLAFCLPGGGSPYCSTHKGNYDYINGIFAEIGFSAYTFDYVGMGHWPVLGTGVQLSEAALKATQLIEQIEEPFVLYARCLGTLVFLEMICRHEIALEKFCRKVILWGAPSWGFMNTLFTENFSSVADFNQKKAVLGGFKLHENFYNEVVQLEKALSSSAVTPQNVDLLLAFGDKDTQSDDDSRTELTNHMQAIFKTVNFEILDAKHPEESMSEQSRQRFVSCIQKDLMNE